MKIKILLIGFILITVSGCVGPPVKLIADAQSVKVGKSDPADNYTEIGPITATDGKGCGGYGYRGTYDRAVVILKNKAISKGGNYVQIFSLTEPHSRYGCFDNIYKINGTLFKKTSESPSPLPILQTRKITNIEKLRELKLLMDEGVITQNEFNVQKTKLLENGI